MIKRGWLEAEYGILARDILHTCLEWYLEQIKLSAHTVLELSLHPIVQ